MVIKKKTKVEADKTVRVTCEGATAVPLASLVHFQGNLKSLANSDYERLKKQIMELGFTEPVSVWKNGGKVYILNGHQRTRTLKRMADEGYHIPNVPINFVEAADVTEAKKKVLSLTSQYGKMDKDGLHEFLHDSGIEPDELFASFSFPEIDLAAFTEEFYIDGPADGLDVGGMEVAGAPGPDLGPPPAAVSSLADVGANTSHVKMVQLFFAGEAHKACVDQCADLAKAYGTQNITDTVAKAVEKAHAAASIPA